MMTCSNSLVYSCECILLSYLVNVFHCVLCCLFFIDMFHIQMQLMQRQDQWNEYVHMCFTMATCFCISLDHFRPEDGLKKDRNMLL